MSRCVMIVLLAGVPGFAQEMTSYDGDSFPEDSGDGWVQLDTLFPAERWLEGGWLYQAPVVLPCPPQCTTRDLYRRELDDQAGDDAWFMEWIVVSSAPLVLSAVAPASIVASGTTGVLYHFTIGEDSLAFKRGSQFPLVFADFAPGSHLFRLELFNNPPTGTYSFTIDGEVVDAGEAEAFYPTDDSFIVFGAKAATEDNVTSWDYVRFGRIPDPGSGDMTGDGLLDLEDFRFFLECIDASGPETATLGGCLFADMNLDGDVDFHDFGLFQRVFTGSE